MMALESEQLQRLSPWLPAFYKIEVEGEIPGSRLEYFSSFSFTRYQRKDCSVVSRLTGPVIDQSELAGILVALVDLCLPIISVTNISMGSGDADE